MNKEQAKNWMEKIGHMEVKLDCDKCSSGSIPISELFNIFEALIQGEEADCSTCQHVGTRTYHCKECKQYSYWEEKE